MNNQREIERIAKIYRQRKETINPHIYSFFNSGNLFTNQSRERNILSALKKYGITSLKGERILDIGCGTGCEIRNFVRYGAMPENCFGVDLLQDRIDSACAISPNIHFRLANAERLPYEDNYFDIILLFTVLTSIFELSMKKNIAMEALRVLKPSGLIIYYDFYYNNPKNRNVKKVKKSEIYELFLDCDIELKRITLAPPLVRMIAPYSYLACYILECSRIINTHYLGIISRSHYCPVKIEHPEGPLLL